VRLRGQEDTSRVDRLHQLFARSLREIEAHASELAETETGAATIYEAGQLLAALRLWAQSLYRPDRSGRSSSPLTRSLSSSGGRAERWGVLTPGPPVGSSDDGEAAHRTAVVAACALRAL
jgi:hypothetical protein